MVIISIIIIIIIIIIYYYYYCFFECILKDSLIDIDSSVSSWIP